MTTTHRTVPAASNWQVAGPVLELLDRSHATLLGACAADTAGERYVEAHLGALRAAAALLAARSRPEPRSRPRSVWEMLPTVAPDLAEWAVFFAGSARRRSTLERGAGTATSREADDLLRQAETFLELVQADLGLPISAPLPSFLTPATSVAPAAPTTPAAPAARSRQGPGE